MVYKLTVYTVQVRDQKSGKWYYIEKVHSLTDEIQFTKNKDDAVIYEKENAEELRDALSQEHPGLQFRIKKAGVI